MHHCRLKAYNPDKELSLAPWEVSIVDALLSDSNPLAAGLGPPYQLARHVCPPSCVLLACRAHVMCLLCVRRGPTPHASQLQQLEQEMFTAFARSQVLTPDDFRAGYASAQERIAQEGAQGDGGGI